MNNKEKKIEGGILEERDCLILFKGNDGSIVAFKKVYDVFDSIEREDDVHREFKIACKILSLESQIQDIKAIVKELIKEMELRVTSFEYNRDLNKEVDAQHGYWDGKRSEAKFMVEKLNWILENGGL